MSVEARLQALVQNYRAQHGDAGLHVPAQLIAQLSSQAPDLYGEIRALAAVIASNGLARIAASPDREGEAQRVATEIAGSEKLSMAVAIAGVAVARTLGPVGGPVAPAMPPPPPGVGGWAGETVVAHGALPGAPPGGYAPPAPQQPYGQPPAYPPAGGYVPPGSVPPTGQVAVPLHKNKIVIGAAAAVVLVLGYAYTQRDRPTSRPGPQPTSNGQAPVAAGPVAGGPGGSAPQSGGRQGTPGEYPTLAASGAGPALQVNRMQNGYAIPFLIQVDGTATPGGVIVPLNGWDQGPATVVFGQPGDTRGTGQIVNTGSAQMQRIQGQSGPARVGQVQWQQDTLNLGPICISFQGNGQSQSGDVGMSGTTMCVMDATCQQTSGCGTIR